MESVLDPFLTTLVSHSNSLESDSDMEIPQLSESLTETENDTPPETPLRSTMILGGADHFQRPSTNCKQGFTGSRDNLDATSVRQARSSVIPPPAHVSEPLTVATPHPIRPVAHSFRSFGVGNRVDSLDEEDGGYDSEYEGQATNRPGLPRLRSYHLTPNSDQGHFGTTRPGLPRRAASLLVKRPREHGVSPLTTPTLGSSLFRGVTPPLLRRPCHPPPMDRSLVMDSQFVLDHDLGDGLAKTPDLGDLLGVIFSRMDETQLASDSLKNPSDGINLSTRIQKDWSNKATGLGLGLPSSLEGDNWRSPTVVPMQANKRASSPTSPDWMPTPGIHPVQCDDSDMSPLELPMPIVSPLMSVDLANWRDWDVPDMANDALLHALEMGTCSEVILASFDQAA